MKLKNQFTKNLKKNLYLLSDSHNFCRFLMIWDLQK